MTDKKQHVFSTSPGKIFTTTNDVKPIPKTIRRKAFVKILLYCNNSCSYFYHKYEDNENCWCAHPKMEKCIAGNDGDIMRDYENREIPEDCPLQDV